MTMLGVINLKMLSFLFCSQLDDPVTGCRRRYLWSPLMRYAEAERRAMSNVPNPTKLAHETYPLVLKGQMWEIWEYNIRAYYKPGKDVPP